MIAQDVREGQIEGWQGADRWILDLGQAMGAISVMISSISCDDSSKFDPQNFRNVKTMNFGRSRGAISWSKDVLARMIENH